MPLLSGLYQNRGKSSLCQAGPTLILELFFPADAGYNSHLGSCIWSKDFVCPEGPNSKVDGISTKWSLTSGKAAAGLLWELYSVRQTIYHFL